METPSSFACPRCGLSQAAGDAQGLCPRCLARTVFGEESAVPPEWPVSLATLRRFGDYELREEIARGGMGVVYRARQISLDREVAVKLLRDGALATSLDGERFRTEAATAASLRHPHIVAIHEIGEYEGQQFFSMDLIDGRNLAELTRDGPLPARSAARLLATVADAIQHAHDRGVLHRDLKPSNVIIDGTGEPHVTDFGLAWRAGVDSQLTLSGQILGTPGYMAPEQAAGRTREITVASDTYSLGAILYHLLTARAPFVGENPGAVLRQVEDQEPVAPRLLNPAVPRDLETITLKALSKDVARRYPTARALAEDLGRFTRGEPVAARPAGMAERTWRWCRRKPALATLAGVSGVLTLTVLTVVSLASVHLAAQRRQVEQVKRFLTEVLASPDPTRDGREVRVIDLLDRARRRAATELAGQPLVRAEIQATLGVTYYQLSQYAEAEPLLRSALELYTTELGPDSVRAAEARAQLGSLLLWSSRQAEAEVELQRAVTQLRRHQPAAKKELASALGELGSTLMVSGRYDASATVLRESIRLCHELGPEADQILASSVGELATSLGFLGRREESYALGLEAIAINRRLPDGKVNLATCLSNLADWEARLGRFERAEASAREALAIRETLFGTNSSPVAFSHARLAQVFVLATNLPAALEESQRALALAQDVLPPRHRDFQFILRQKGLTLIRLDRAAEAEPVLREACAIAEENYGAGHGATRNNKCLLAEALAALDRRAEARDLLAANLQVIADDAQADPDLPYLQERLRHYTALLARLRDESDSDRRSR